MDELQQKLEQEAKLTSDIALLEKQVADKQGVDAGLEAAVAAKKRELAELGDKIRNQKQQDESKFENVRKERVNEALTSLKAKHPELSDPAKLQAVVDRFNSKDDSGKFEIPSILKELELSYYSVNPDEFFKIVEEGDANKRRIEAQQRMQAGGAGANSTSEGGDVLTPEEQEAARILGLKDPNFLLKLRDQSKLSGGLLTGNEKVAE